MGTSRLRDMNSREMFAIAPICALCLWIGVMPQPLLEYDPAGRRCGGGTVRDGTTADRAATRIAIASDAAKFAPTFASETLNPEPLSPPP